MREPHLRNNILRNCFEAALRFRASDSMYLSRKLSSGYKTLFFDVSIGGGPSDPGSLFFIREDKDKPLD